MFADALRLLILSASNLRVTLVLFSDWFSEAEQWFLAYGHSVSFCLAASALPLFYPVRVVFAPNQNRDIVGLVPYNLPALLNFCCARFTKSRSVRESIFTKIVSWFKSQRCISPRSFSFSIVFKCLLGQYFTLGPVAGRWLLQTSLQDVPCLFQRGAFSWW